MNRILSPEELAQVEKDYPKQDEFNTLLEAQLQKQANLSYALGREDAAKVIFVDLDNNFKQYSF
jgi:hypothetical protein